MQDVHDFGGAGHLADFKCSHVMTVTPGLFSYSSSWDPEVASEKRRLISGLAAAILNFTLPVTCYSIGDATVELADLENGGLGVIILFLFRTKPEI